jgi:prevent-host-death family protein
VKTINIQAAKTHLSRIVDDVVEGEEVILAKAGKPLVRLVRYESLRTPRTPGIFSGKGWEAADCWEADDNVLSTSIEGALFHGAVEEPPAGPKP